MSAQASYTITNSVSEVKRLADLLFEFCEKNSLPEGLVMEASLALEEVFANVVLYAFSDAAPHDILVCFAVENGALLMAVEDDGIAFNPLDVPPVDTSVPLENRPIGGLGIHLVRSVMNEVKYTRTNGRNRLEMRKDIPRGAGSAP